MVGIVTGLVIVTHTQPSDSAEKLIREIVNILPGGDHPLFDLIPYPEMKRLGFAGCISRSETCLSKHILLRAPLFISDT